MARLWAPTWEDPAVSGAAAHFKLTIPHSAPGGSGGGGGALECHAKVYSRDGRCVARPAFSEAAATSAAVDGAPCRAYTASARLGAAGEYVVTADDPFHVVTPVTFHVRPAAPDAASTLVSGDGLTRVHVGSALPADCVRFALRDAHGNRAAAGGADVRCAARLSAAATGLFSVAGEVVDDGDGSYRVLVTAAPVPGDRAAAQPAPLCVALPARRALAGPLWHCAGGDWWSVKECALSNNRLRIGAAASPSAVTVDLRGAAVSEFVNFGGNAPAPPGAQFHIVTQSGTAQLCAPQGSDEMVRWLAVLRAAAADPAIVPAPSPADAHVWATEKGNAAARAPPLLQLALFVDGRPVPQSPWAPEPVSGAAPNVPGGGGDDSSSSSSSGIGDDDDDDDDDVDAFLATTAASPPPRRPAPEPSPEAHAAFAAAASAKTYTSPTTPSKKAAKPPPLSVSPANKPKPRLSLSVHGTAAERTAHHRPSVHHHYEEATHAHGGFTPEEKEQYASPDRRKSLTPPRRRLAAERRTAAAATTAERRTAAAATTAPHAKPRIVAKPLKAVYKTASASAAKAGKPQAAGRRPIGAPAPLGKREVKTLRHHLAASSQMYVTSLPLLLRLPQ